MIGVLVLTSAVPAMAREEVYYFINDHLGTPQKLVDKNAQVVWEAEALPFGETVVNEDPDGDGTTVTCNLRFPGQYYDAETGWHYNYHRYYDPKLGRYLRADPVGDFEGNSLYAYGKNNPVHFADPFGLKSCPEGTKEFIDKKIYWYCIFQKVTTNITEYSIGVIGATIPWLRWITIPGVLAMANLHGFQCREEATFCVKIDKCLQK